jgi:hypothetical protein
MNWDPEYEERPYHDASQICLNGHHITGSFHHSPEYRLNRCTQCGEATIMQCTQCKAEIRGDYRGGGMLSMTDEVPNFCSSCGDAFPWLERKIEGIKSSIDELPVLKTDEKDRLKLVALDLVVDSPKSQAATMRYKTALEKVAASSAESKAGAQLFTKFIIGIASAGVREAIKHWPT